jgi:hypothetical protein
MLWPWLIEDPVVIDTVEPHHLFLPPDRQDGQEAGKGIGPAPWGYTGAFLLSREQKRCAEFRRHFVPKLGKLSDRLIGAGKVNLTSNAFIARAMAFTLQLRKQDPSITPLRRLKPSASPYRSKLLTMRMQLVETNGWSYRAPNHGGDNLDCLTLFGMMQKC